MPKIGDRVRVKATTGGPDIAPSLDRFRLRLWGCKGVVVAVFPYLDWPILVEVMDPDLPPFVRFWKQDLLEV